MPRQRSNTCAAAPKIAPGHIGILGHSEGGQIAPIVAARCKDARLHRLDRCTGRAGDQILVEQLEAIGRADGASEQKLELRRAAAEQLYALIIKEADLFQAGSRPQCVGREPNRRGGFGAGGVRKLRRGQKDGENADDSVVQVFYRVRSETDPGKGDLPRAGHRRRTGSASARGRKSPGDRIGVPDGQEHELHREGTARPESSAARGEDRLSLEYSKIEQTMSPAALPVDRRLDRGPDRERADLRRSYWTGH